MGGLGVGVVARAAVYVLVLVVLVLVQGVPQSPMRCGNDLGFLGLLEHFCVEPLAVTTFLQGFKF